MLPDHQLQLLTAAVDGELTPRQNARLQQLLTESPEAQSIFSCLHADSNRLRALPEVIPPTDLRNRIMLLVAACVPVTTPTPVPTAIPAPRPVPARQAIRNRRQNSWVPLVVASSLLIGISACSFWFFTQQEQKATHFVVDQTKADNTPSRWNDILPPVQEPPPSTPTPTQPSGDRVARSDTQPAPTIPVSPEILPPPRVVDRPVYGYPTVPPLPPLDLIQVRIPYLVPASDLLREDTRQRFGEELGREPAYRIDLFVNDTHRGVERFEAAAKGSGIALFADATGLDRIRKKQATSAIVYIESLTPIELRDLLTRVVTDDAMVSPQVFDMIHVTPLHPPDHRDHFKDFNKELRDLFGVDLGIWKKAPGAKSTEPKSISSGTGNEIVKSLTKPGEKSALLMAYSPIQLRTPPATSVELKHFLSRRGDRKPNAIPVVIVIRN